MIVNSDIDPNAQIDISKLEGHGFGIAAKALLNVKEIRYVDSNGDAAADLPAAGTRPDKGAFLTLAYAVTQVPKDTLIVVRENHTETVTGDDFAWAAEGIKVLGLGTGNERPTFTFTTATAATINLDEANLALVNLRFINGIASQVAMVRLADTGLLVHSCFFQLGDASTQGVAAIYGVTDYSNSKIIGNEVITTTDAGATNGFLLNTTANNVEVAHNFIYGDFANACIHNAAANALTLLRIHHNILTNLQSGDHAIQLLSACTGVISHNVVNSSLAAVATKTAIDPGSCYCVENYGSDGDGDVSGILNPVADS